jgi:hypothetical protein
MGLLCFWPLWAYSLSQFVEEFSKVSDDRAPKYMFVDPMQLGRGLSSYVESLSHERHSCFKSNHRYFDRDTVRVKECD